jgi:hypothetical protein
MNKITQVIFKLNSDSAMTQVVSHRPLTMEVQARSGASPCGICGKQSGPGTGFSASFQFSH